VSLFWTIAKNEFENTEDFIQKVPAQNVSLVQKVPAQNVRLIQKVLAQNVFP
jgi:hypothetical protein